MSVLKIKGEIIFGLFVVLCLAFWTGIQVKGDEKLWDLKFTGGGNAPYFQSSVKLEIQLVENVLPDDIKLFVNHQEQDVEWQDETMAELYFEKEGIYSIKIEHESGQEEIKTIYVEINSPERPEIDVGDYNLGTWTSKNINIKARKGESLSGVSRYEYKFFGQSWTTMKDGQLTLDENFEGVISFRTVSNAGQEGSIVTIPVRLWKTSPDPPEFVQNHFKGNRWYQKIPEIKCRILKEKGPEVFFFAKMKNVTTGETCTMKNKIPQAKEDGIYKWYGWCVDEAGNISNQSETDYVKIDRLEPQIKVKYIYPFRNSEYCKKQKVKIYIRDLNLNKQDVQIETTGRIGSQWKNFSNGYSIVVDFSSEGKQYLSIKAKDYAGNQSNTIKKQFQIDNERPKIILDGIRDYDSYKNNVKIKIMISDSNRKKDSERIYLNGDRWIPATIKKDGYYCLEIYAKDYAGNFSKVKRHFIVNKKGIKIQLSDKNLQNSYIRKKKFIPAFKVESLEPVQVVKYKINGENKEYRWNGNLLEAREPIKSDGKYIIEALLIDSSGNTAESEKMKFVYDTEAPEIMTNGIDSNHNSWYGQKIRIQTKKKEDKFVRIILDGVPIKFKRNLVILKILEPGKHLIHVKSTDRAGNLTNLTMKFAVKKITPKQMVKVVKGKQRKQHKDDDRCLLVILFVFLWLAVRIRKKEVTRL